MNTVPHAIPTRPWLESLTAGLLLGLSFPPADLPVLQFPAFLILFRLALAARDWRQYVSWLWPALLTWNLATTYWLMLATLPGGLAAIAANSLLMLIPLWFIRLILLKSPSPWLAALCSGAIWTSYEFAHHNWDLAWPWLTLGNGWSNLPDLVQYISATGHLAISFWVIASSVMLWNALQLQERRAFLHALALLVLFPGLSILAREEWEEQPSGEIDVVVVQPNIDSYLPNGGYDGVDKIVDILLTLSDSARSAETDLIVWPENAIDTTIPRENRFNVRLTDSLRNWQADLITGAGFMDRYEESPPPPIVRYGRDGQPYNIYNAALHYRPERLAGIYKKGKLVPIVERLPFAEVLQRLDPFSWIDWSSIAGYGKGTAANTFPVGETATPALVCYDSVFPGWVRQFVRNGAGFLTIITNDGWWGDTSGHAQHFSYARLRSIEMRQWVVRSANNGISGIITPKGRIVARTDYWTRTAFSHTIHPTETPSLFVRYGNWFNWLMVLTTAASLLFLYRKNSFSSRTEPDE
ncbi:MAG: apolipoprotein N-acyltransferase [Balneolaceae bacterium]